MFFCYEIWNVFVTVVPFMWKRFGLLSAVLCDFVQMFFLVHMPSI
jgi:hypothetical protein